MLSEEGHPVRGSTIIDDLFVHSVHLMDQSSLKNDTPLLVSLIVLCCKLIDPAKLGTANTNNGYGTVNYVMIE